MYLPSAPPPSGFPVFPREEFSWQQGSLERVLFNRYCQEGEKALESMSSLEKSQLLRLVWNENFPTAQTLSCLHALVEGELFPWDIWFLATRGTHQDTRVLGALERQEHMTSPAWLALLHPEFRWHYHPHQPQVSVPYALERQLCTKEDVPFLQELGQRWGSYRRWDWGEYATCALELTSSQREVLLVLLSPLEEQDPDFPARAQLVLDAAQMV